MAANILLSFASAAITLDSLFFRVMVPLYSRLLMMGIPFTVCAPRDRMFNSNFKVTSRSA